MLGRGVDVPAHGLDGEEEVLAPRRVDGVVRVAGGGRLDVEADDDAVPLRREADVGEGRVEEAWVHEVGAGEQPGPAGDVDFLDHLEREGFYPGGIEGVVVCDIGVDLDPQCVQLRKPWLQDCFGLCQGFVWREERGHLERPNPLRWVVRKQHKVRICSEISVGREIVEIGADSGPEGLVSHHGGIE